MIDHAYLAELQAVRASTYASLPHGLHLMSAIDAHDAQRGRVRPLPNEPAQRDTPPNMSSAEAIIAQYCEARTAAISGIRPKRQPGVLQANMIAQLRRDGIEPNALACA